MIKCRNYSKAVNYIVVITINGWDCLKLKGEHFPRNKKRTCAYKNKNNNNKGVPHYIDGVVETWDEVKRRISESFRLF